MYRYSGGIPRLINMLCDRALLGGSTAQVTRIDDALVRTAAEALDLRPAEQKKTSWFSRMLRERS